MSDELLESGFLSLNKNGEELCGDHLEALKRSDGTQLYVLADGLGSGVRANILSTLTSSMLLTLIDGGLSLSEAVASLARTLPLAPDRGNLAYSTFTIINASTERVTIYNFDNPEPVFIRAKKEKKIDWAFSLVEGKKIAYASLPFEPDDTLAFFTDGAVYAGVGASLNFGWTRAEIAHYLEGVNDNSLSAKNLAKILVDRCATLYEKKPGDDTSALILKNRPKKVANLLVGPPTHREDDDQVLGAFFRSPGEHIVCGGTSSELAAHYLHTKLIPTLEYLDKEIPPTSSIRGVDLVTEGIVTLNKVVELGQDYLGNDDAYFGWVYKQDGASLLAKALFERNTDLNFYVGCAVNPAHQDPKLGISISTKLQIVDTLAHLLKTMGKRVHVAYF